jgi:hypothetical protein
MTQPGGADGPGQESQAHGAEPSETERSDPERDDYGIRAETYLRLLAETELRRALACPRSPAERIPPTAVRWAANAVGAVSGTADLAARSLGPAAARAGQGALRFLAPPARQAERALPPPVRRAGAALGPQARQAAGVLAPRARRAGRAAARAGWQARIAADQLGDRVVSRLAGGSEMAGPTPQDSLERVHSISDVLVAARVLSEATATSVTQGFGRALAARGRLDEYYSPRWDMIREEATVAPTGPIVAAGIGARVDLAAEDGGRARMHVLALVLAPDDALVTTVSWLTEASPGPADDDQDWDDTLSSLVQNAKGQATDNRGGTYSLQMESGGGGSDGPWEAQLAFSPRPPAGLDWLDITLASGQDPIRVDLTAAAAGEERPGTPRRPARPAVRAERIVDSVSERLLGSSDPEFGADERLPAIAGLVRALRAAGVLVPDSPALARLVTLIRRLGQTVPGELADAFAAGPADLPEAWLATLEQGFWAGSAQQASAATAVAVLPELDGARCVIAGLLTDAGSDSTTMQVLGWGWPWTGGMFEDLWQPFSWWARDDAGRWYRGSEGGYGRSSDMAEFQIELRPPVHPEATTLEVSLTGMSGQVTAAVPVTWARMP